MKTKSLAIALMILGMLAAGIATAKAAGTVIKVKYDHETKEAKIKQQKEYRWTVETGSGKYGLNENEEGELKFTLPDGSEWKAKRKDDKVKLKNGEDTLMEIRIKSDKYKVEAKGKLWQFKIKDDKIKIYEGEEQIGKIKYYPDKGKLKVKDQNDREVAVAKGVDDLCTGLGPFMLKDLPEDQRMFLVLFFFIQEE